MSVRFEKTELDGVTLCVPEVFRDERGFFLETYHAQKYMEGGVRAVFVQDNRSCSSRGVLRGLHYQLHKPQAKLLCCTCGEIFDVAVDLRSGSATYGQWAAVVLTPEDGNQLWVPPGFAHGFCTLQPDSVVNYKVTATYAQAHDKGVAWDDPQIAIAWVMGLPPDLIVAGLKTFDPATPGTQDD